MLRSQIITCLIGDPVDHSVSDIMFQYLAEGAGVKNYNHLKFKVAKNNPQNLKNALRAISIFGITGANITLPYKESAIQYLNVIDRTVSFTGAVNTIVNKKGKIIGYNTDSYGAIKAIETKLRPIRSLDKIVIFGAGGAARAIIGGLPKNSCITLLSRAFDFNQTEKLKKNFAKHNFKIETKNLDSKNIVRAIREADFIINATPVGMCPSSKSLIIKNHLSSIGRSAIKNKMFFDVVFNPFETKFLQLARQYGARTCSGIYMMIYQGIQAFELWTDKKVSKVDVEVVANSLKKIIDSKYKNK